MTRTIYGRFSATTTELQAPDPARVVTTGDWVVAAAWAVAPVNTEPNWHVAASIDCDVDPGVVAALRLRIANGGTSAQARADASLRRLQLGWTPVPGAATRVFLEVRREFGLGGVRVRRATTMAMSAPPPSLIPGPTYPPGYLPPVQGPYPDQYTDDFPYGTGAGTGRWEVTAGRILTPDGVEFISAGFNGGVTIDVGGVGTQLFGGPSKLTGSVAWAWDGFPGNFQVHADIWPGDANLVSSTEVFPGGQVTASPDQFAQGLSGGSGGFTSTPDRVYALTGIRSAGAVSAGISAPADHWHSRLYRVAALCRPKAGLTWNTANDVTPEHTIPQYVARARELVDKGLVVSVQHHGLTGSDLELPAALVADPSLPTDDAALTGSTYDQLRDALDLLDALCAEFSVADNFWLGLPNEWFAVGVSDARYRTGIRTLIARARATGYTGVITFPLAEFAGDLGGLATGAYDTWRAELEADGLAVRLVPEWHNYGKNTTTETVATYAEVDAQLTAVRAAGWPLWMAEYGQATPVGSGFGTADAWQREAVLIMATATYGQALGIKHAHICPTWWALADNSFDRSYSLTYGVANKGNEAGPDPHASGTGLGTYPWWDVTTTALATEWLTPGGQAHWDLAHSIWQET